jgi:hypothetical protein
MMPLKYAMATQDLRRKGMYVKKENKNPNIGYMVIASASETEDTAFKSRQGVTKV